MHGLITQMWTWLVAHPLVAIGAGVVLALFFWKQPKQLLKLLAALAVLVALGYVVSGIVNFTMSSATTKGQMIERNQ